jgi:hypothetical protein
MAGISSFLRIIRFRAVVLLLGTCFLLVGSYLNATPPPLRIQYTSEPQIPVVQFDFQYTFRQPLGLLNKRFGPINGVGAGVSYRTINGLIIGADFSPLWSDKVKETQSLDSITGPSGYLIDNNGNIAIIRRYMFGFHGQLFLGYLFKIKRDNPHTGIVIRSGFGFLQHKIRHQFTQNIMPQLEGDMYKGYDRLTRGTMFTQYIGYQYSSALRPLHLWGGITFDNATTYDLRGYNYTTRTFVNEKRIDRMVGIRAGVIIPLFLHGKGRGEASEIYFK